MGGVDYHNWLVSNYSISVREKKWYWSLFTCCIDVAVENACILYEIIHCSNAMALKDFRAAIDTAYLKITLKGKYTGYPNYQWELIWCYMTAWDNFVAE